MNVQVYAASIMFGYFLRRVDTRFQLSRRMGLLAESTEDTVARLERLFAQVGGWLGGWLRRRVRSRSLANCVVGRQQRCAGLRPAALGTQPLLLPPGLGTIIEFFLCY